MKKRFFSLAIAIAFGIMPMAAEVTTSYYSDVENKSGISLFNAIHTIANEGFKQLSYDDLWTAYAQTDLDSDGKIIDMYGGCNFTYKDKQCGNYSSECSCYNREHSIPKSWFCACTSGMGADIFHLVPTDGQVNGKRSNYAFGESDGSTYTYNDNKLGSAKSITVENTVLGSTYTTSSLPSTVFEPQDEFKGDFARGYFGTMIKWTTEYTMSSGDGKWFFNNTYTESGHYGLADYGLALLIKWHRQDPVSQKEIDRNNGIQATQGNRNPFIDYPYLVEYIWGEKAGETVSLENLIGSFESDFVPGESNGWRENISTDPTITSPKSAVAFGAVAVNKATTQTITVKGRNLTDAVTLTLAGTNSTLFGLSATTVSAADALAGKSVTITYTPTTEGEHTATLTLKSNGAADVAITLTGNGATLYKVTYDAGSGTADVSASNETTIGGGVVLTTATVPTTCSDWTFVGWTTATVSETQTAPTLYAAGDTYYPTSNCTLYAVYKMGGNNTKVTTLNDGDVVVIYYPTDKLALTATANSSKLTGVATTVESNSVTSLGSGAVKLTVEINGDYFRLKNGNDYLICPATGNGLSFSTATDYADWMFEDQSGINCIKNVNAKFTKNSTDYQQYLEYYNGFTTYSFNSSNTSLYQFEFYKYETTTYTSAPDCKVCTLTGITLNTDAVAKTFTVGDKFSSDGLVVTANYSDCESRTITPTVTKPDMSSDGSKTVTISYTENGTTKSTYYTITVEPKPTYTITWSVDGSTTPVTYTTGDALVLPATTPTACDESKLFVGWTATKDYANETTAPADLFTEASGTVTANKTYYAVFGKQSATTGKIDVVTTLTMTDLGVTETGSVTESKTIDDFTITPSKANASNNPVYNVNGQDLRIYAKGTVEISSTETMTAIEFEISTQGRRRLTDITVNSGSMSSIDTLLTRWEGSATSVTFTVGATATYGSESNKAGQLCFTAVKITTEGTGSVTTITNYTTTCTTTPAATYTISTSSSTGGTCSANKTEAQEGEAITLSATPNTGYKLAGWTVLDGNADYVTVTNNQFIMPASDVEVEATFAKIEYTITTNLTNATAAASNPTTATITDDDITLTFVANNGYELPATVAVTMGSTTLTDNDNYIWNKSKGTLEIIAYDGVQGNICITIVATAKNYTITFKNGDETLQSSQVAYGTTPTYSGATPTKAATAQYEYTFSGWSPEIAAVTGEATYTAQFTQKVRSYTVTFVDYDGKTLDEQSVEYGNSAVAPESPTRAGYIFAGWDKAFDNITEAITITATYRADQTTAIDHTTAAEPICHIANGTLYVTGLTADSRLALYDITGRLLATRAHCAPTETFAIANGIYIVKIGDKAMKIVARCE